MLLAAINSKVPPGVISKVSLLLLRTQCGLVNSLWLDAQYDPAIERLDAMAARALANATVSSRDERIYLLAMTAYNLAAGGANGGSLPGGVSLLDWVLLLAS